MSAAAIATRPYIGLRYFEERDAHLFFGRDEHVAELLGKLAENRFVAVMGSSGCGKSSLVRAGLLPELRSGMIPKAGPRWKVVEFKPGRAPMAELAEALRAGLGVQNARELVEEGPLGIARGVAEARLESGTNVLVIADQFEEVFRFEREESEQGRGAEATEQCQGLARRLLDAAAQMELPIYVLLVMRSDYLGECAEFPDLPERMSESLYLVPRLRRDQLQEAITGPVGSEIEPAVVQRLLGEVGSDPDQLPRLQHLLGRMWDEAAGATLTMEHYTSSGGWEGALEKHLEEVFMPGETCRLVFQQLGELDKGRAVRRRVDIAELVAVCGPEAREVVAAFRAEGFLTPRENPVEVTHECILREWPRLREWLEREDRDAKRLRELADATKDAGWRPRAKQPKSLRGLEGLTLQNLTAWRETARPTAPWARRYRTAVDFETADSYLTWSQRRARRQKMRARWVMRLLFALAVAFVIALVWFSVKFGRLARDARGKELTAYAALLENDDPALALYVGWRAAKIGQPLPVGLEAVLADALANGPSYGILHASAGAVNTVAWSPDGKLLASGYADKTIRIWDAGNGALLQILQGHSGAVFSVAWSPDGKTLASGSGDQTIRLWETATGKNLRILSGHDDGVGCVAWSPNGKTLASGAANGTIGVWDVASGDLLRMIKAHTTAVNGVGWSPDGKRLASASDDSTVRLWEPATGHGLGVLKYHKDDVNSIAWSPDGQHLVSGSKDETVLVWDAAPGRVLHNFEGHQGYVWSVAWSADGQTLASAGHDRTVRLWNATSGQLRSLRGHQAEVNAVSWNPDGKRLASASSDGTIRLWNAETGVILRPARTATPAVEDGTALAWSPDGNILASGNRSEMDLWQPAERRLLFSVKRNASWRGLAWSPNGKLLASPGDDTILLWNRAGQAAGNLGAGWGAVDDIAWRPDGVEVAAVGNSPEIRLGDVASRRIARTISSQERELFGVAWSPDGKRLGSAGRYYGFKVWDVASGQPLSTLPGFPKFLNATLSLTWSPDGKTLGFAGGDSRIRLWDATRGKIRELVGHQSPVWKVAWSPDGKALASASFDLTVRLWDAAAGRQLRVLKGHRNGVTSIAWSPDGKMLASASSDGSVRLWPGTARALVDEVHDAIRLYTPSPTDCQRYFGSDTCPRVW